MSGLIVGIIFGLLLIAYTSGLDVRWTYDGVPHQITIERDVTKSN